MLLMLLLLLLIMCSVCCCRIVTMPRASHSANKLLPPLSDVSVMCTCSRSSWIYFFFFSFFLPGCHFIDWLIDLFIYLVRNVAALCVIALSCRDLRRLHCVTWRCSVLSLLYCRPSLLNLFSSRDRCDVISVIYNKSYSTQLQFHSS